MWAQVDGGAAASAVSPLGHGKEAQPYLRLPAIFPPSPRTLLLSLPHCLFWQIPNSRAHMFRAFFFFLAYLQGRVKVQADSCDLINEGDTWGWLSCVGRGAGLETASASSWSVLREWGPGQPCVMDLYNGGTGGTVEVMKGGSWRNSVTGSRLLSQNGNPVS